MLTDSLECERSATAKTQAQVRFWKGGGGGISNHTFLKTTPGLLIITTLMLEQINSLAATDPNTPHEGICQAQDEPGPARDQQMETGSLEVLQSRNSGLSPSPQGPSVQELSAAKTALSHAIMI